MNVNPVAIAIWLPVIARVNDIGSSAFCILTIDFVHNAD